MLGKLFEFGPYEVCALNIIIIAIIVLVAMVLRRIIHRSLKSYLNSANIRIEGKRVTYLKLFSQSVYAIAAVLAIYSFSINNNDVTFKQFLEHEFIKTSKFVITFENLISVLIIIFGSRIALNLVRLFLARRFRKDKTYDRGREYVYMQVAKYIIYTIAFFLILNALNVQPTLFLGGSAAILVGLGLGIQDVFKDMFSGLVLLFEGSIRVGDVIQLHDGKSKESIVAKILRVNVRTTQIETRDGNILIVPNAKLTQEYIENWTHGATSSRFRISVTVEYGSNVKLVEEILVQSAMAHPKVNKNEQILVRLYEFGENGLQLELIFWADQSWDINNYKSEI
ncbi:MAG: mechanosensitive ion channel family protein, partial [Fluviicola sp.]